MNRTTFTSRAVAGLVAAVAGFASYSHIYDVATGAGEHEAVAAVLPLAIDGLILVATLAMLADKRDGRKPRFSARVALVFGVVATVAANVASAAPTMNARLVAVVPAVSFLLAVEVLSRRGKLAKPEPEIPTLPAETKIEPASIPVLESTPVTTDTTPLPSVPAPNDTEPTPADDERSRRNTARRAYRQSVTAGKPLSGAALGRQFGMSDRWGRDRVAEVRAAEQKTRQRQEPPATANGAEVPALAEAVKL
ncbi:DUF2637 domain-containing protein [Plantactinospora sp. BB1]|uniref:DUF2637 domain-containing protein n=1 Tax=Plantactinospora sp. BB1 TaxID=2071627 RepID=UPI000D16FEA3|nr:DUF2637 domain-containing protein [Plantactinospora sp. BB1]AVT39142.1 hypothetical protein C6W10_24905 [Plantactinospora sp. BB1]